MNIVRVTVSSPVGSPVKSGVFPGLSRSNVLVHPSPPDETHDPPGPTVARSVRFHDDPVVSNSAGDEEADSELRLTERLDTETELQRLPTMQRTIAAISFFGEHRQNALGFNKLEPFRQLHRSAMITVIISAAALLALFLFTLNKTAIFLAVAVLECVLMTIVVSDYTSAGMSRIVLLSLGVAVITAPVLTLTSHFISFGMQILPLLLILYIGLRLSRTPTVVHYGWFVAFAFTLALFVNLSATWFTFGDWAIWTHPLLMSVFETGSIMALSYASVGEGNTLRDTSTAAATLSCMATMIFATVRLAMFLVTWQVASTFTICANLLAMVAMEICMDGGVIHTKIFPWIAYRFPSLEHLLLNEHSVHCLLVYVSVGLVSEYYPIVTTCIVYAIWGSEFKVIDLAFVDTEDAERPFRSDIMLGLLVYVAAESVIASSSLLIGGKTKFRHCWVWDSRRILAGALHESLHYGVCPILTAVLLAELSNDEEPESSGNLSS
eukprot:Rmarinus@m.22050